MGLLDKENGAAYGSYVRSQNETGWAVLNIAAGYSSQDKYKDEVIMKAAGIIEGALTQPDIYSTYLSQTEFWFSDLSDSIIDKIRKFYEDQRLWMEGMIGKNKSINWQYVNLIYQQFQGLIDGYNAAAPTDQVFDTFGFDFLNGNGDWLDIMNFIDDRGLLKKKRDMVNSGHCSALIKVLPGFENIFASHSSWYTYSSMLRIYKHYAFKLQDTNAACQRMSFSSYPGFLSSLDDFYIMDSKMMMLQTTNPILNHALYNQATTQSLLAWHRVRLANWLASNGCDWAEYIKEYNSGTYNNQYMVLDLKLVNLTNEIRDNALWVVEQIPGLVEAGDQTAILREGYWASYNIPFYKSISELSGIPQAVAKNGPKSSHDLAPRAKIFRRDQTNVKNMTTMFDIMRYNGYKIGDPYAEGSPINAICSRGDLMSVPMAGGCTDTKAADYNMALQMLAYTQNGPTHTQGVPIFKWSTASVSAPHYGQPDVFNFSFVKQSPQVP